MKTTIKTLTAVFGLACLAAGTAAAEEADFTVTFPYDAAAGLDANRAIFEDVARRACRHVGTEYIGVTRIKARKACQADLVTKAIAVAMNFEAGTQLAMNFEVDTQVARNH